MTVPTAPVAPTTATRYGSCAARSRTGARPRPGRRRARTPRAARARRGRRASPRHDARDLDRRGGDHLDVDALRRRASLKTLAATPGMRLHSGADDRHLAHLGVARRSRRCRARATIGSSAARAVRRSVARDGERHVAPGAPSDIGLVLDDHVDVDVRLGERREDAAGDARVVGHAEQRDARLVVRVRDGGDQGAFHRLLFSDHEGTGRLRRTRTGSGCARRGCARTRPSAAAARRRPTPTSRASPRRRRPGSLRASGTIRGSALKTPATSV